MEGCAVAPVAGDGQTQKNSSRLLGQHESHERPFLSNNRLVHM